MRIPATWATASENKPGPRGLVASANVSAALPVVMQKELPIIQQTYDLILWYVPHLNKLPRDHRFTLGERVITGLYDLLEQLILARYEKKKIERLEAVNSKLDVLRHQTRLLKDLSLIDPRRYAYAANLINEIGKSLGGWIRQQKATAQ